MEAMKKTDFDKIKELEIELKLAHDEKLKYVKNQNMEKAALCRDKERSILDEIDKIKNIKL